MIPRGVCIPRPAVILAAGNGTRLKENGPALPKPLVPVLKRPLLERVVRSARQAGVDDFLIVVGQERDPIRDALGDGAALGVRIRWVLNPQPHLGNGISLLCARDHLAGPFFLLMADHLFDPQILKRLAQAPMADGEVWLACDPEIYRVFDLDDATRVQLDGDRIAAIGKNISPYNAIDSGCFLATPAFLGVLEKEYAARGDVTLSEGMRRLAKTRSARALLLEGEFWHDVDTREALHYGERALLQSLRKPTDGWISRHLNRPISLWLTRRLAGGSLSPNQVTWLNTALGTLSACCLSRGGYAWMALGTFLFQATSIADGVDGELARLDGNGSRYGAWADTASDLFITLLFPLGLAAGLSRQGEGAEVWRWAGLALAGMLLGLGLLLPRLWQKKSGSLLTLRAELQATRPAGGVSWLQPFAVRANFLARRDFYAFLFFAMGIGGWFKAILILVALGSQLIWITLLALLLSGEVRARPSFAKQPQDSD